MDMPREDLTKLIAGLFEQAQDDFVSRFFRMTNSGAAHVEPMQLANESAPGTTAQIGVSIPKCTPTVFDYSETSKSISNNGPGYFLGVYVNAQPSHDIILRNGVDASGESKYTIPAGIAAGTRMEFPGSDLDLGIFAETDAAATSGNITTEWWAHP